MARLVRWAVYLVISLLFLAAVGVSLGRYLVTWLPHWTTELEQAASDALGAQVSLGRLSGRWKGPYPGLTLEQATVRHPLGRVTFGHIDLELDLWRSLWQRQPLFRRLDIRGVAIHSAHPLKAWPALLQEVMAEQGTEVPSVWPELSRLTLRDVRLTLPFGAGTQTWSLPALTLGRTVDSAQLWLEARLKSPAGTPSGQVVVRTEPAGDIRVWLHLPDVSVWQDSIAQFWPERLYALEGDLSLWATFGRGQWQRASVQTGGLSAGLMTDLMCLGPVSLGAYAARLTLEESAWQLSGTRSRLTWSDQSMVLAPFTLKREGERYDLQAAELALSPLSRALRVLALDEDLTEYLTAYAPEGTLADVHVFADEKGRYTLEAVLNNVSARAVDGSPAGRNIQGVIRANAEGGWVQFNSAELTLAFPELYSQGWRFRHASGRVQWRIGETRDDIWGEAITLEPAGGGRIKGRFALVSNAGRPDLFSLDLAIHDLPARQVPAYVPDKAVSEGLMRWLRGALQAGRVEAAHYRYDGYVGEGTQATDRISLLNADVRDLKLEFSQGWPALEVPQLTVGLSDGDLDVSLPESVMGLTQLRDVKARLRHERDRGLMLSLEGQTYLSLAAQHWWIHQSPMARDLPDVVRTLNYNEPMSGTVALELPLDEGIPEVFFALEFDGGTLTGLPHPLQEVNNLNGALRYSSSKGLSADALSARWRGTSLTTRIETLEKPVRRMRIESQFEAGITFWQAIMSDRLARRFAGSTPVNVVTEVPEAAEWTIKATSDLSGLAVDLPAPLAKPDPESIRHLSVEVRPVNTGVQIRAMLEGAGGAGLVCRAAQTDNGWQMVVSDTEQKPGVELPEAGELRLVFETLNLKPWQSLLESLGASADVARNAFNRYHLKAGSVQYADKTLSALDVIWQPETQGWRLAGQARGVAGELHVQGPGQLKVRLSHLDLDMLTGQAAVNTQQADWIPQRLPSLDLVVERLVYKGRDIGRWQGRIEPVEDGALARDVEIRIGDSLTTGSMHWVYTAANKQHNTVLSFESRGKDFQVISDAFALNAPISSSSFQLVGSLVWMDRPDRFDWSQLFGRFDVDMNEGVIRDVAASTNIFRLLGVLNTETLTRRLKLDFSDLYKQGMAYDKLGARTRIQAGVLRFVQPLSIQTPSSAYNLSGSLDLVQDTLDMQMIVALPVSKNLPLAAILLGAPQVGGALFLLDKLLGDPLSNLTTATFDVKGTLTEPKVTLKNIMNPPRQAGEEP